MSCDRSHPLSRFRVLGILGMSLGHIVLATERTVATYKVKAHTSIDERYLFQMGTYEKQKLSWISISLIAFQVLHLVLAVATAHV